MNLAELLDWSIALVPVLVLALLFAWLDVFKLMSPGEMLGALALGGLAALLAWPISGQMLDSFPMGYSFYSRVIAPWIEEALNALPIALLLAANRIGYKIDAIIVGFAIGAGFSVVENIFFLFRYPELGGGVWMVRGLGTAVMHGTTAAVLAVVAHELGERSLRSRGGGRFNPFWLFPGYATAGMIHLLFNQFPEHPGTVMMVTLVAAPLILIALLRFGELETQQWLAEESEGHRLWLDQWRSDGFPDDASGRRIAALAERVGPDAGVAMRAYCIQKLELVLTAEEELLDRDRRLEEGETESLRAAFDRLAELRKAMGPSGYAALRPLLPFSRNDEWELSELRELVRAQNRD